MSKSVVEHCHNLKFMSQFSEGYFDLLDDDPPYFSGPEKRKFYGKKISSIGVQRVYEQTDEWELPTIEYFNQARRVSKNQIIWGANYFDFIGPVHPTPRREYLQEWLNDHPVGWIVWDKCNGNTSFNDFELAWTSFDRPTVIYQFMWNGMLQGKSIFSGHIMQGNKTKNQKRIHPTEKPIPLYKWQFLNYTRPGDKIISNYVGSGADRIAAYDMGLDFYGCELTKVHFENMTNRFKKHISQQKLFI